MMGCPIMVVFVSIASISLVLIDSVEKNLMPMMG